MPLPPTAQPLVYGTTISTGVIDPSGDLDLYCLAVSAGDRVTLTVSRLSEGDPCVELVALDGTSLQSACTNRFSAANSATITRTFTQAGAHPLLLSERGSDEKTTFAMTAQCLEGPCTVTTACNVSSATSRASILPRGRSR